MKAKNETRNQLIKRIDKMLSDRMPGHVVCRTCGEEGCCIFNHDNLREVKQ